MNALFQTLLWLSGVLEFIGLAGGCCFWAVIVWLRCSHRGRLVKKLLLSMEKYSCSTCKDQRICLKTGLGGVYPCLYYEKEDKR